MRAPSLPRRFFPALAALCLLLAGAFAQAAPGEEALAMLRELRVLDYRVQTSAQVIAMSGTSLAARTQLANDIGRAEALLDQLDDSVRRDRLRTPVVELRKRWAALRNPAALALAQPPTALAAGDANNPAVRPRWRDELGSAGDALAAAIATAMRTIPGPDEPAANIDFALAALELQYLACRYTDSAGVADAGKVEELATLAAAFDRRVRELQKVHTDGAAASATRRLADHWLLLQGAVQSAQKAPMPLLVARHTAEATDTMIAVFAPRR